MHRAIALAVLIAASPVSLAQRQPVKPPDQYGRFVVTFSPLSSSGVFLVDTQTGRTWQLTGYTDLEGTPRAWVPIDRIDNDAQHLEWIKKQTPLPSAK